MAGKHLIHFVLVSTMLSAICAQNATLDPLEYVDTLIGSTNFGMSPSPFGTTRY